MTREAAPLSLADLDALAPLLKSRWTDAEPVESTLSDPWFANLYLFRQVHAWRWVRGEWPCIAGRAYDGTPLLLPLFDPAAAPPDALRRLLGGQAWFGPLSAAEAARLDPAAWSLVQARDEADYVYPAAQFRGYPGAALQNKRRQARQLLATQAVVAVNYAPALAGEAGVVLDAWMDEKAKRPGEADEAACREALALAGPLGLEGTLYRVGGRPAGFVLAETLRPAVMAIRFAKALADFNGLYPYMFQQFCQARASLDWLNFEQDLGIASFRRSKLSYQPAHLLDKFRARLR